MALSASPVKKAAPTAEPPGNGTGAENTLSPDKRLWRDRNFNIFWAGQTFDALGDSASSVIMPLLVFAATGSIVQMGFVTATIAVGSLTSGLVSGMFVDRLDRRKILIFSDIGRAAFFSLIPLSWWLVGPSIWLIYVVAAATAFFNIFFNLAYNAAIPNIVDQDQITAANGRLQTSVALAYVGGPMAAGFASKLLGAAWSVEMIAIAYLTSALLMFGVRLHRVSPSGAESTVPKISWDEYLAGIRFLMRQPVLRAATMTLCVFLFFSESTIDLTIFRLKDDLGQNDQTVGIVFGVASLGAILAGIFAGTLRKKLGFGLSFLGSMALQGAAIALTGTASTVPLMAILATLYMYGLTFRIICIMSLRQQLTPDHLLGRLTSVFYTLTMIAAAAGTVVGTAVAEKMGTRTVLISIGIMGTLVALIGFLTPAHSGQPEKDVLPTGEQIPGGQLQPSPPGMVE